ncbi:hypothetical protein F4861DRAFT_532861 [Xylaria intraflava]|nr:hypothetical protein F4861DRAFT_532861 [Xylaria intraflava]
MRLENSARYHRAADESNHLDDPFIATDKLEKADNRTFHKRRRTERLTGYIITCSALWFSVIIVGLSLIIIILSIATAPKYDFSWLLYGWGKSGAGFGDPASHSTNLFQSVTPRPCHSHNDYWRKVPVYSALQAGCTGIEADVWLFDKDPELYVGHDRGSLTPRRTFRSLYVNPLVEILQKKNAAAPFRYNTSSHSAVGVFDADPEQGIVLLVDIKTDGTKALDYVQAQLAPLRANNWLTYVKDGFIHKRQVTVVGTGSTPFDMLLQNSTYRDIFFDAPLNKLYEDPYTSGPRGDGPDMPTVYNMTNSFYASVNFKQAVGFVWSRLSQKQLRLIRGQIKGAHRRGLKVRYWNTPAWPISLRNKIWDVLEEEGADVLNVDDLEDAAKQLEMHDAHSQRSLANS